MILWAPELWLNFAWNSFLAKIEQGYPVLIPSCKQWRTFLFSFVICLKRKIFISLCTFSPGCQISHLIFPSRLSRSYLTSLVQWLIGIDDVRTTARIFKRIPRFHQLYEEMVFFYRKEFHFRLSEDFCAFFFELEFYRELSSTLSWVSIFFCGNCANTGR